jgi:hypothetical protein
MQGASLSMRHFRRHLFEMLGVLAVRMIASAAIFLTAVQMTAATA